MKLFMSASIAEKQRFVEKDELQTKVGQEVSLDIVLDPLLNDSQCMVETDGGLFDCSMDTEMRNLIKEIKALS